MLRTCGVSLWGELFRGGNNQITIFEFVGFAQQEVTEELLQMFKFRLDVAGIVAIVGTDKSIAESTAAKNPWEVFSSQAARTFRSLKNRMDTLVIFYFFISYSIYSLFFLQTHRGRFDMPSLKQFYHYYP